MTSDLNPQRHLAAHVDNPDVTRRAQSFVARTARNGSWSRDDLIAVMEALDWHDYPTGGRVTSLGGREKTRRSRKRLRPEEAP